MSETNPYKDSLNLPETDFPMKASLAQTEPRWVKKWQEEGVYQRIRAARSTAPRFVLNDGPPYANGPIHMGHAVNKILKDMINKSKLLSGFDVPFIPGWDCHGLPIELQVEKKIGKAGHKVSAFEFRKACRDYAEQQIEGQKRSFIRLGVLADWEHPYKTMDFDFEANTMKAVGVIAENGHLQKGYKPIHWCLDCGSALAEAEVEYEDKISDSIDVAFLVADSEVLAEKFGLDEKKQAAFVIWTTTPWTLPANQAVAIKSDCDYALVDTKPYAIIVASDLLPALLERYAQPHARVLAVQKGQVLAGLLCQHPFEERQVPVVCGTHVTLDAGTGCVHTAPAHGQEDFQLGVHAGLPLESPLKADGCYQEDTPFFGGQYILKAQPAILQLLKERAVLWAHTQIEHSYPHCWRHKTALIFRATPQWFISMDKKQLREDALAAIKTVQWLPEWGEVRISNMIETRPDWCISRQRTWGVPIPLFLHKDTGDIHPKMGLFMPSLVNRVQEKGIEAWHELDLQTFLGEDAHFYQKAKDTLDVWFESGVVHSAVLDARSELHCPAEVYLEGSDQHRGWFHSSLLTSVAMKGIAPYKTVLTHGYVVDAQGRKMSKSLGNVVDPEKIVNTMGADVLRLRVSAIDYRVEMVVSDQSFQRTSDAYRRIRNTVRFLLSNLNGFDFAKHAVPVSQMVALDAWIVSQALRYQEEIKEAYDTYQFHIVYQKLQHFCINELGGFYLDVIKDRQYTTAADGHARRSAQTALFHVVEAVVRWMAPILSFTAEEVWRYLPNRTTETVFLAEWYDELQALPKNSVLTDSDWDALLLMRKAVNKGLEEARAAGRLGSGLEAEVTLYADEKWLSILGKLEDELRFVLITSQAKVLAMQDRSPHSQEMEGILGLFMDLKASESPKCVRCWHRREDVNTHAEHPGVCSRCITNMIEPEGERRFYA